VVTGTKGVTNGNKCNNNISRKKL